MKKNIIFIFIFFLLPLSVDAATIRVVAPATVNAGDVFFAEVFLDTEGESVNAVEGSIPLPENVSVSDVRYKGSVVSLWLSVPSERTDGVIDFEGVIPGGYQASPERIGNGNLFTLVLKAENEGPARFSFGEKMNVYRNDGEGTPLPLSKSPAVVTIVSSGAPVSASVGVDAYAPEPFVPEIVPGTLYGIEGDVVVFGTHDKDSGVRSYDIGFSYIKFLPEFLVVWSPADSPYQLSSEVLGKYIFIRAVDNEGNVRIATLSPQEPGFASFFLTWGLPVAVLLFIGFLFFAIFTARRKVSLK